MHDRTSGQIAAERAITMLGGPVKAASTLRVPGARYQTVQSWLRNRVPAEYCPAIERETLALAQADHTGKTNAVTCEQLRPDIDWGVLRGEGGRAPVAAVGRPNASAGGRLTERGSDRRTHERREGDRRHGDRRDGPSNRKG